MDTEAVASTRDAVGKDAAAAGRQRRGAACAATGAGDRRSAERNRCGRQRADVLRISAPIERLIAKLDVHVSRSAQEINTWRAERRRRVRLGKIKKSGPSGGRIGDGNVEPAVRGLHGDGANRGRRWSRRAGV